MHLLVSSRFPVQAMYEQKNEEDRVGNKFDFSFSEAANDVVAFNNENFIIYGSLSLNSDSFFHNVQTERTEDYNLTVNASIDAQQLF